MSDAVHYLTRQDTGTPSNSSGCDGFPFPIFYGAPGLSNPIIVPLAQCAKWYKRVKNWQVTTNVAMIENGTGHSLALQGGATGIDPGNPTRELQLVDPSFGRIFKILANNNGTPNVAVGSASFVAGGITNSAGSFYPFVSMLATLGGGGGGSLAIRFLDFGAGLPSFTGHIDGVAIPIYYDAVSGGAPASFTVGLFDLTPLEYWPYAAADGSPIYDTVTGAQLQNPQN